MDKRLKVLFIDPWGVNETGEYTNGICGELQKYVELTLVTNYYFNNRAEIKNVLKFFFKRSEKMRASIRRKVIRGMEYVRAWKRIVRMVKREQYDIVHINWLLMYRYDSRMLKKLKKCGVKIIYTAHNVTPHINGEHYIRYLKDIYASADKIIVHGETLKKQFSDIFPSETKKVYVQRHGYNLYKDTSYDKTKIESNVIKKMDDYEKKVVFIGNIFEAKGTDRLFRIWLDCADLENTLLIVAGKENETNTEWSKKYMQLKNQAKNQNNVLVLDYFVSENMANYLIDNADLIVLPYREASMSGVVFTAVDFRKPIFATNVGSLSDYLGNTSAFLANNREDNIANMLVKIIKEKSPDELSFVGEKLAEDIIDTCSWSNIVRKLYNDCYCTIV